MLKIRYFVDILTNPFFADSPLLEQCSRIGPSATLCNMFSSPATAKDNWKYFSPTWPLGYFENVIERKIPLTCLTDYFVPSKQNMVYLLEVLFNSPKPGIGPPEVVEFVVNGHRMRQPGKFEILPGMDYELVLGGRTKFFE